LKIASLRSDEEEVDDSEHVSGQHAPTNVSKTKRVCDKAAQNELESKISGMESKIHALTAARDAGFDTPERNNQIKTARKELRAFKA